MAKISVIIPAYNAERSLERTVRSVLGQTLKDLEVWIVDDGSTDRTGVIADQLAAADSRVRVLHQTNQRAYAARINALKRATAPYFAFVDADDTLEPQMYERMYEMAEKHGLDVVQCEQYGVSTGGEAEFYLSQKDVRERYVIPYLIEGKTACFVWDKLYKRHLAEREFETSNILMFEDIKINLQIFDRVRRMGILHEGLYHYDVNSGSSVSNFRLRNIDDFREIIETRARWASAYGIAADDVRLSQWIAKNMKNYILSACMAKAESFKVRVENVRAILGGVKFQGFKVSWVLLWCWILPLPIAVGAIRFVKTIQRGLK